MKIYLAGPIFTEAEIIWTQDLKSFLERELNIKNEEVVISWPYEQIKKELSEHPSSLMSKVILDVCVRELESADVLVAVLDGAQVDDGTAWEIGYFQNKHPSFLIGFRSDSRHSSEDKRTPINSLIYGSLSAFVSNRAELLAALKKFPNTEEAEEERVRSRDQPF